MDPRSMPHSPQQLERDPTRHRVGQAAQRLLVMKTLLALRSSFVFRAKDILPKR